MLYISNIELEMYNKKCEINNRGEKLMKTQEKHLTPLASTFVILGIVLGSTTDRLIGYSFIGTGVLLSIISWIKSKKDIKK